MLDSVLDESEIQAGCNISLQVSNIKSPSTSRMNFCTVWTDFNTTVISVGKGIHVSVGKY